MSDSEPATQPPDASNAQQDDVTASTPSTTTPLYAWAQLVRLPNVFTVLADVSAAFLLVAHGPAPVGRLACVLIAGVALYWAGMVLNDVFDIDRDREERPTRPIAAGDVPLGKAKTAGWALLIAGVLFGAASGYVPAENVGATWLPAAVAVLLAIMIVLYDGPLKKTPLAPAAMGSCRVLSFLLGASPMLMADSSNPIPDHVFAMASGFGIYIMGITTMARREAVGGRSPNLLTGYAVLLVGLVIIAVAPRMAAEGVWRIRPERDFPLLIGLIALPVVLRGMKVQLDPTPLNIQNTIRAGILSIIPLAAAVALLGAGRIWGVAVFALVVPSILLAKRLRVT